METAVGAMSDVDISRAKLISIYKSMYLSRVVEEKFAELYRAGARGLYHLYIGQEAVSVGVCAALNKDDYIFSTHRGKGHYIAKGGDVKAIFAEFLEKATGCNRGKGGPLHVLDLSVGMMAANGLVGASPPLACGAALSAQVRKSGQVAVAFFGDGGANAGPFHESLNLAALWKLPVVFVCENNLYQGSVPLKSHSCVQNIFQRAQGYGIPGFQADGMDVIAVYKSAQIAVERARIGQGPTLLEFMTYRFRGHSEADSTPGFGYRSREEVASWQERCPLKSARTLFVKNGWVAEHALQEVEQECHKMVAEALAYAESSPAVQAEWAMEDVFTPSQECKQ